MKQLPEKLAQQLQELAAEDTLGHFLFDMDVFSDSYYSALFNKETDFQNLPFCEQYDYLSFVDNKLIQKQMIEHFNGEFCRYKDVALIALNFAG